jgi:hypothetical protein
MKTPIQAYTDTLPTKLKDAILNHHVLVGMSTDMVLFAMGQPDGKSREIEGQMPFEEWIYGKPPKDVEFVRINGNRVIRLEVAKMGETPVIFTKDEVEGLMRTDGTPLDPTRSNVRVAKAGDVQRDPDKEAAAAPPSLRNPGETLPTDDQKIGVMKPVRFPKQEPDKQPGDNPDNPDEQQTNASQPNATTSQPDATQAQPSAETPQPGQPPSGPPKGQPLPPAGSNQLVSQLN